MYKKFLIISSKRDKAGANITTNLSQFRTNPLVSSMSEKPSFDFYLVDEEIIYTKNLDKEKINKYDFIIFASKHKSGSGEKTLSIHAPGNFRTAEFGGENNKVCPSSALLQKHMFEVLNSTAKEYDLQDYNITLECTHHGPLIEKPCLFIEIGSTETEWADRRAGFIIAKTIADSISSFKPSKYREVGIGIGGPHYCPNFNLIQLHSNIAISHIIPQYSLPLTEEIIQEALDKTEEEVDFVVLDWKGLGTSEQRQDLLKVLDKLYIRYKKTSEINK